MKIDVDSSPVCVNMESPVPVRTGPVAGCPSVSPPSAALCDPKAAVPSQTG